MTRGRIDVVAEVAVAVILLLVIALTSFSYPHFADNSGDVGADDGYPYYARHLDEQGTLIPEFRRLPGYPLFLVACNRVTGLYYSKAASYVQGVLSLLIVVALYVPLRRIFGPLFAIVILALLAAPNLWVRLSVLAFPDFIAAVLCAVLALLVFRWLAARRGTSALLHGGAIVATIAAMILIKSGMTIVIAMFAAAMVIAHLWTAGRPRFAAVAMKAAALIGAALVLQAIILAVCGSGSVTFYRNAMHARIATYLPPAGDTEAERIVERAKDEISSREGQRMEDENFTNTLAVAQPAVEAVWRDRLAAYPVRYLGVMADELRRKHYLVAMSYTPFMADITPTVARIPRKDDSTTSRVYRATGVYLQGLGDTSQATAGALAQALVRTALFWPPLVAGLMLLYRRSPFVTLTLVLTCLAYIIALAFGIFVDGRYLLPFAPLIYGAQATAFAALLKTFVGMGEPRYRLPQPGLSQRQVSTRLATGE